jgi:hypothetical protein
VRDNWAGLTPEEKRQERFKQWLSPDVKFLSPQAEESYKKRTTRFIKAISLEEPDRVPVILPAVALAIDLKCVVSYIFSMPSFSYSLKPH